MLNEGWDKGYRRRRRSRFTKWGLTESCVHFEKRGWNISILREKKRRRILFGSKALNLVKKWGGGGVGTEYRWRGRLDPSLTFLLDINLHTHPPIMLQLYSHLTGCFFWLCVPPQGFPANFGCCYWCHRRDRGEAVLEKCPSIVYCPLLPCNNCSPLHPLVHSSNALTYYPRRLSTRMWSGHETFSFYSW